MLQSGNLYLLGPKYPSGQALGVGARYDLNDNFHLLGYLGRGVLNTGRADQLNWYTSILFTF
jgi:hypothetical protein